MAEWLVVAGVSIVIMATVGLLMQAAFRGHSALLFLLPLAGWRQVQENWDAYGRLALLRVLGAVCVLCGLALIATQQPALPQPGPPRGPLLTGTIATTPSAFVASQQAALLMARGEGQPLAGRVHGQPLTTPRASLINGVLSVSQGEGFLADLSISVMLGWTAESLNERRTLLINPADRDAPDVHLSWRPSGHHYPETRIFHNGYRLELVLAPLDRHQLRGRLQLVLPDNRQSYLVGTFTAYTNHLRFRNGEVDLDFDHPDTLGYVAEQYLQTQYPNGAIDTLVIEHVKLHRPQREGEVQARIVLTDGTVQRRWMALAESSVGWSVTPGSLRGETLEAAHDGGNDPPAAQASSSPDTAETPAAHWPVRQIADFKDLATAVGQDVTVIDRAGRHTRGRLLRVASDRPWLRVAMGAGRAALDLAAERVAAPHLEEQGERPRIPHEAPAAQAVPPPAAPPPRPARAPRVSR